jgi:Tol biopolymer transport system component
MVASEKIGTAPTVRYAAFAASGQTLIYRPRFVPSNRLVWIDRRGIVSQQIGEEGGRWRFPALSPDGTRLVALREDRSDTSGLWLFDLVRDKRERLASGGWVSEPSGGALMSAWARDSNQVVYSWQQPNHWSLHRRAVTGGADEVLFAGPVPHVKRIRDVTDDIVLVHTDDGELWVIPFVGEGQPYRLPIEGEKNHARVSPNGRWLAYDSTEGGVTQVYVTAFPVPAERWLISTDGGSDPQWRGDGHELYYIAANETLMAVSAESAATFNPGTPEPLFRAPFDPTSLAFGSAYAPAPDGQRFLVVEAIGDTEPHLVAILNWTSQR